MAIHSSILAWRIPWTESLAGYSSWGRRESDTTEWLTHAHTHKTLLHSPPTVPTSPALGHDFFWFCSSLRSYPVLHRIMWNAALTFQWAFVFILMPLLTACVAYSSSLMGSAGLERPCIQEDCAQLITDQLHALWRQSGDRSVGLLLHILIPWANGNKV